MPNGVRVEMTPTMLGTVCWTAPGIIFVPQHSLLQPVSFCARASSSGMSGTPPSTSLQKCWQLLRSNWWRPLLSSWWTWAFSHHSSIHPARVRTCCNHSRGCQCSTPTATVSVAAPSVSVAAPSATKGAPAPAAAANVKGAEEPTFNKMEAWLMERGLLSPEEGLSEEQVVR